MWSLREMLRPRVARSPFHEGERRVQRRLGVRDIEPWARRVVRPHLPEEHRAFHTAQPFLVAAARDERGRPWATMLVGDAGFVTSPDPFTLAIDAQPATADPLAAAWREGADVGLLGIELSTRRRNRVNGRLRAASRAGASDAGVVFSVDQSFGNCPQYIQERTVERVPSRVPGEARTSDRLDDAQRRWIEASDTFFVATGHRGRGEDPAFGMDASHRGGEPGFVRVDEAGVLVFPDYAGNNHFNTIGNLMADPRIGLLFVDFEHGHVLQLTGRADIVWEGDALDAFPQAQRLVRVAVEQVVERPRAVPLRWRRVAWRALEVVARERESDDVVSIWLGDPTGERLPAFGAGQHLPIRVRSRATGTAVERTYSLSGAPDAGRYRLSVKREPGGIASEALHDGFAVGDSLEVGEPRGDFALPEGDAPVFLVSAGVGVTPLLSMLHEQAGRAASGVGVPPITWVHAARDGGRHAFVQEVRALGRRLPRFESLVAYSRPRTEDVPGRGYARQGRLDLDAVAEQVAEADAHVRLCGPPGFAGDFAAALERAGVPEDRLVAESF